MKEPEPRARIRFMLNGDAPTPSEGEILEEGDTLSIPTETIHLFQAVTDDKTKTLFTITVEPDRVRPHRTNISFVRVH